MDKVAEMPQWTSDVEVVASRKKRILCFFENISAFTCKRGLRGGILASENTLKAEIK